MASVELYIHGHWSLTEVPSVRCPVRKDFEFISNGENIQSVLQHAASMLHRKVAHVLRWGLGACIHTYAEKITQTGPARLNVLHMKIGFVANFVEVILVVIN